MDDGLCSIERYIYVCHSKKSKYLCTNARALIVSFSIKIVSFAIALPYGFWYQVEYYTSISEERSTIIRNVEGGHFSMDM